MSFPAIAGGATFTMQLIDLFIDFHYIHQSDTRRYKGDVCVCVVVLAYEP